ncbi:amino acid ABC transporter substrate-binding protein [Tolypothrix sp. FACHB-123]|uniref:ABC transporter substrate-binding protein n=1 Tax=Tolypothrix sp. FACHB-123 TaxID=2692868 RepID=UPI0016862F3C|nr:ABC transporter substrate-binding protein [Tolypothrix sp. FACHB-123]MBD2356207.1 amino acid ABC transporter substrate-binding protein [Tolypothrix sp. FACHB-123]
MAPKDENIRLLVSLGIAGVMVAGILLLVSKLTSKPISSNSTPSMVSPEFKVPSSPEWMSRGERILVTADKTEEKEAAIKAFNSSDFGTAIIKFQASLQKQRNDPETLIYLNNAKIGNSKSLKVAAIAPIGTSLNEAQETLRGVAQAQDEVNSSGGINGVPLQVEIVSLNNSGQLTKIDDQLVKDNSLLAVVGFGRNEDLYRQNSLVRVSPNSARGQSGANNTQRLGDSKYVFNISPNRVIFNQALAEYIVKKQRRTNIVICRDSSSINNQTTSSTERPNQEIVKEYNDLINRFGGKVTDTECDLGAGNFSASNFIAKATSDGAEAVLLIPRFTNINPVIDIAKENRGRLALFGSQQLYSGRVLKFGQGDVKGMVVAVPWHRDANRNMSPGNSFAEKAAKLWGGEVSPRTATAYDAMQVIIAGLKEDSTRQGLQKVLSSPNFMAMGATGKIQFTQSGDREGGVFLVKIEPCDPTRPCPSGTGYDFVLVQ